MQGMRACRYSRRRRATTYRAVARARCRARHEKGAHARSGGVPKMAMHLRYGLAYVLATLVLYGLAVAL